MVETALIDTCDALLLDLDGVVYAGPDALPGVAKRLGTFREAGVRLLFVTNNAARTAREVGDHLRRLDIPARDEDVLTSAQAAAAMLARRVPTGARVLVIGGAGLVTSIEAEGLEPVFGADDDPVAVVQGFHPDVGWRSLAEGAYAVARGIPWVASNTDRTLPTERGVVPGNGALVETIRIATGRDPEVAGKPEPGLFIEAVRQARAERPLVVGDRLDTDIAGARAAGLRSLLVLTGVTDLRRLAAAHPSERPTYTGVDLGALERVQHVPESRDGVTVCGGWRADLDATDGGATLRLTGDGGREDAAQAAVAAVWEAADAGRIAADSVDLSALERCLGIGPDGAREETG